MNPGLDRRAFMKAMAGTLAATSTSGLVPIANAGEPDKQGKRLIMDTSESIAAFANDLTYKKLPPAVVENIKMRLLDMVACGIGAIGSDKIDIVRNSISPHKDDPCTVIGSDMKATAGDAALVNTSMTRYLDYMDSYVGPYGGGHPSDCIASIIACTELTGGSTRDLIASIAASYEIVGAFADNVETRDRGWDHLGFVGVAMAGGAGRALGLDKARLQNAVSIMAASYNPLRVTRAEQLTMWKGFAAGYAAFNAVQSSILAMNGMVGPRNTFSGSKGWNDVIAGEDFTLDFTPGERALKVWTKLYLAETYALSAVEGAIELAKKHDIDPAGIDNVHIKTFHDAILNIGADEGRDPYKISTRSEADHSFPYMIAAALLDRQLSSQQYTRERIHGDDVQGLLKKVTLEEDPGLNSEFAKGKSPADIVITMKDGTSHRMVKEYFTGHPKNPATRKHVIEKLRYLNDGYLNEAGIEKIISIIDNIENHTITELTSIL